MQGTLLDLNLSFVTAPCLKLLACLCPTGDSVVHSSQRRSSTPWGRWKQGEKDGRHSCLGPGVPESGPRNIVWADPGMYSRLWKWQLCLKKRAFACRFCGICVFACFLKLVAPPPRWLNTYFDSVQRVVTNMNADIYNNIDLLEELVCAQ